MRRPALLVAVLAVTAAACGGSAPLGVATSSSTSAPVGPPATTSPGPVVITESTTTPSAITVGGTVEVELTSSSYDRSGRLVPWVAPASSAPGVLVRSGQRSPAACPLDATCSVFVGVGPGTATLSTVGPSGILCTMPGTHCIGVTAVMRRFVVSVAS
ncbi:MAG TPA: hypothetical protein VN768_02515 [Acidimicrobiales bacterium]|nr:hypothetical protein [Acidimicrobiales bacterium]